MKYDSTTGDGIYFDDQGHNDTLTQTISYATSQSNSKGFSKIEVYETSANVWNTTLTTEPLAVWMDDALLTKGSAADSLNDHEWFWASNILYLRDDTGDPDGSVTIEAAQRAGNVVMTTKSYITLDGLHLKRSNTHGIRMVTDGANEFSDIIVKNCTIEEDCQNGISIGHNNAGQKCPNNVTIDTCTITDWGTENLSDWLEQHVGIFQRAGDQDRGDNLTIKGCTIAGSASGENTDGTRNGIEVLSGDNILIESNDITTTDHALKIAGSGAGAYGAETYIVRFNNIHDTSDDGIFINGCTQTDSIICYNIFDNNSDNAIDARGVVGNVYNNVIYNSYNASIEMKGINVTMNLKNNIIMNFSDNGVSNHGAVYLNGVTLTGTFSNNCYYKSGESNVAKTSADGERTLAQWQADQTQDVTGTIVQDPLMTDPGSDDFTLQVGSPCINRGTFVGLILDYLGLPVPIGHRPDIGAYEHKNGGAVIH